MALVQVSFVGGDMTHAKDLQESLSHRGVPVKTANDALAVSASSIDECNQLGAIIAAFIDGTTEKFALRIDGPGADSVLRQLHTPEDAEIISGMLAAAAFLL